MTFIQASVSATMKTLNMSVGILLELCDCFHRRKASKPHPKFLEPP